EQLKHCNREAKSAKTMLKVRPIDEFRESYSEEGTSDAGLARAIYDSCLIVQRGRCHTVADGRFYKCPQSYFLPKILDGCAGNDALDSIAITDSERFGGELLAFLESAERLASCGYCLGTAGRRFPHEQVSR